MMASCIGEWGREPISEFLVLMEQRHVSFFNTPFTFITALGDLIYSVYESSLVVLACGLKASHCSLIIQEVLDLTDFYANKMQ